MEWAIEYHKAAKAVKMIEYACVLPYIPICYARPYRLLLKISLCCAPLTMKDGP